MSSAHYRVALLPGDGTGPEVVREGRKVLETMVRHGLGLALEEIACGAQLYQRTGEEWEPGGFERARSADALLLGAVGWPGVSLPDGNIAGFGVVFGLRLGLDLYANERPCRLYPGVLHRMGREFRQVWEPSRVDMMFFRENTEGLYTPAHGELTRGGTRELALDTRVITRKGSERIIRRAFEAARHLPRGAPEDGRRRVTCVDKSNVLRGCQLFRQIYDEVAEDYPDIERDYAYVDAFTQWLVRSPEHYQVVVTTNLFGDIVTDLAATLQGGLGFAAGGNVGEHHGMFEPVHGSAPKYAGKNQTNPFATFEAVVLLLRWLGGEHHDVRPLEEAERLERALARVLASGKARTYDQGGHASTSEVGEAVVRALEEES